LETQEISAGESITIGGITLLPIINTSVRCWNIRRGIFGFGSKTLDGIVVVSEKWTGAMNVAGEEVPVERYTEKVPEVKELLKNTR
jgi:hypothetical protein